MNVEGDIEREEGFLAGDSDLILLEPLVINSLMPPSLPPPCPKRVTLSYIVHKYNRLHFTIAYFAF